MQEKVVKQIIKMIDKIIFRAMNISYNKNISKPSFSSSEIIKPDQSGIHYSNSNIDISISSEKFVLPITKIVYRIPQTRFYITYLQTEDFYIRSIEFFNLNIVIVEYLHGNSQQVIEMHSKINPLVIQHPDNQSVIDGSIKFQSYGIHVAQISDSPVIMLDALVDYIKNCINEEINSHPISIIQTDNAEFLKVLDQYWSLIHSIKKNNVIDVEQLIKSDITNFIWIQEIYLQFGWFDQLEKFYNEISKIFLSPQFMQVVATALYRYNFVCKLIKKVPIQLTMDQKLSEEDINGEFLNKLIRMSDKQDDDINEMIQTKWNYLHIPAMRLKVQRLIQENPDEYVAYALLALQYRSWWYEILEKIILEYLPEEKRTIYMFLALINQVNIIRYKEDSIYFSRYNNTDSSNLQIRIGNSIIKKDTIRNKEHYSCLEYVNKFYIRISKNTDFEYFPSDNKVKIRPQIYQPYNPDRLESTIGISKFNLQVPLIWDQMTIEFNKCRFKFLRKKGRFQVIIKFAKSVSEIKLNNDKIENNFGPVVKYYIPINHVKSEIGLSLYNVKGGRLKNNYLISDIAVLKGTGYNIFGILNNHFRTYINEQKKSDSIDLDAKINQQINFKKNNHQLKLTASKFDPVNLQLDYVDPFLIKLIITSIFELFRQLKIYIEFKELNINEIINLCVENLGFAPQIENISELVPDRNNIICIICSSYGDQILSKETKYRIIPINKKTRQTALWINPEHLSYLFSETFFTSLFD